MDGLGPKTLVILLVGILLGTESSKAQLTDDPDLRKERRLHRIYEQYSKSPTPNEVWEEAAKKATDPSYVIQKGDNLWDISKTFFGDPNFWPKLWSLNPEIYNPHEILPKGQVVFKPGTIDAPPAMGMGPAPAPQEEAAPGGPMTSGPTVEPPAEAKKVMLDLDLTQIAIPPPAKPPAPLTPIHRAFQATTRRLWPIEAKLSRSKSKSSNA